MNKKAISAIVATVLIILITVAAVTIIWAAIIPMINKGLGSGTACFDAVPSLSIDNEYTCIEKNGNTNNLIIYVKRNEKDYDLVDLQIQVTSKGNTDSYRAKNLKDAKIPKPNEERKYNVTGLSSYPDSISVAAVVKMGKSEKLCGISSTLEKINSC